jgi:hypothetical protein
LIVMQLTGTFLTYDGTRRRLWIAGQRCHHGATGALMTMGAAAGVAARRSRPARAILVATTGTLLMAHDWKDRSIWFQRGWQNQP